MPKREKSAIILVRPNIVSSSDTAIFTKHKSTGERPEEKGVFQALHGSVIDDPTVTIEKFPEFWHTRIEEPKLNLKNWMNQRWMDVETPIW